MDDPSLDARGSSDGIPWKSTFFKAKWTSNEYVRGKYYTITLLEADAVYYERGYKRINKTREMTKSALDEFRKWVKKDGGCKCKEYFGVNE